MGKKESEGGEEGVIFQFLAEEVADEDGESEEECVEEPFFRRAAALFDAEGASKERQAEDGNGEGEAAQDFDAGGFCLFGVFLGANPEHPEIEGVRFEARAVFFQSGRKDWGCSRHKGLVFDHERIEGVSFLRVEMGDDRDVMAEQLFGFDLELAGGDETEPLVAFVVGDEGEVFGGPPVVLYLHAEIGVLDLDELLPLEKEEGVFGGFSIKERFGLPAAKGGDLGGKRKIEEGKEERCEEEWGEDCAETQAGGPQSGELVRAAEPLEKKEGCDEGGDRNCHR